MKRMTKAAILAKYTKVWDTPGSLRFQARCAYLDGRVAYAKEMSRRANVLERHEAALRAKAAAQKGGDHHAP